MSEEGKGKTANVKRQTCIGFDITKNKVDALYEKCGF